MRCLCSQWGLSQCHTHCHMHRLDLAATGRARVLWARGHVGTLGRQCKRAGRDRLAFVSPLRRHVSGVRHDAVRDQISGFLAQLARCAAPPSPSRSRARVLRHGGPARTLHRQCLRPVAGWLRAYTLFKRDIEILTLHHLPQIVQIVTPIALGGRMVSLQGTEGDCGGAVHSACALATVLWAPRCVGDCLRVCVLCFVCCLPLAPMPSLLLVHRGAQQIYFPPRVA